MPRSYADTYNKTRAVVTTSRSDCERDGTERWPQRATQAGLRQWRLVNVDGVATDNTPVPPTPTAPRVWPRTRPPRETGAAYTACTEKRRQRRPADAGVLRPTTPRYHQRRQRREC